MGRMETTPAGTGLTSTLAAPPMGHYEIDPGRSAIRFRTRHLFGLAPVRGRFAIRGGTIDVAEPPTGSTVRAEIDAASFHTPNPARDQVVKSARFLDVSRHPVITFFSERLTPPTLHGTLTVHGVSQPVALSIEQIDVQPGAFTARATAEIDRTDFGVTASRGMAGTRLGLTLEIRCVRS
jgi:polyisoprenoid-binding protein YceI